MALDVISMAIANGYTDESLNGVGALKGANATVLSITQTEDGNEVVFQWTANDGTLRSETMHVRDGIDGEDGQTPDIQVGTVTTLPPGSGATVERDPDSPDAAPVFHFGIPRGEPGAPGSGGGSGGTTDHDQLTNRDADDQHPISAITGLSGALGIRNPVAVMSQSAYEALSDEEKMDGTIRITTDGRQALGVDGTPVGTIISYMGQHAPAGYLICDGAELDMIDYAELAEQIAAEFGSSAHFGGDGETTFALPDLRNLFLRGYHGNAANKLSGNIGEIQEGTADIRIYVSEFNDLMLSGYNVVMETKNYDKIVNMYTGYNRKITLTKGIDTTSWGGDISGFTSRPVNAAVLYCIKYTMMEVV